MKIDNHSHVFNLNFIPVAGVIREYSEVKLGQGKRVPIWICKAAAKYFLWKTKDPSRQGNTKDFKPTEYEETLSLIFNHQMRDYTQEEILDEEVKEFIIDEEGNTKLSDLLTDIEIQNTGFPSSATIRDVLRSGKSEILMAGPGIIIVVVLIKILGKVLYKKFLEPYFTWFDFMTKPYEEISSEMIKHFKEIDLFVHLDMDMANWYPLVDPTYTYDSESVTDQMKDKETQVARISKLTKESNGKVVPFYAYDPNKPLEPLKNAIKTLGYIGVKFYPPSGYLPIGNPAGKDWDEKNFALYNYCVSDSIPILSHCNQEGMQAGYQEPKKGNPLYWKQVLDYETEGAKPYKDLLLCFGHAGGDEEWFYANDAGGDQKFFSSFCGTVYYICTEYKNVYCDLSYMHKVTSPESLIILHERLIRLFKKSKIENRKYLFEDKIIYGSDWHMIMQEHGSIDYLPAFLNLFKNEPALEEKFFHTNAAKFLNLGGYLERGKNQFLSGEGITNIKKLVV